MSSTIGGDGTSADEGRLAWIVEAANVVEAPLYLQITRELQVKGLLDPVPGGQQQVVNTRGTDRSQLRLALLETWRRSGEEDLDITLEIAVAQGFKHAANRRPTGPLNATTSAVTPVPILQ